VLVSSTPFYPGINLEDEQGKAGYPASSTKKCPNTRVHYLNLVLGVLRTSYACYGINPDKQGIVGCSALYYMLPQYPSMLS